MNFAAIDIETANPDCSSICQIGVAFFENGKLSDTWSSLVDPRDYFDPWNIRIHGISQKDVSDAPTFADVLPSLRSHLAERITVCHTQFDRVAIDRAAVGCNQPIPETQWLDSARVARRAWRQFSKGGYGLANLAKTFGITFRHHDALEDAIVAGKIVVKALEETQISLEDWLAEARRPVGRLALDGDRDGPLYGEQLVFTGRLSLPRRKAAKLAARAGCDVANTVSEHTTLLIVGMQDLRRLRGKKKSNKHLKAEELITSGAEIRITAEEDFLEMMRSAGFDPDS